MYNNKQGVETHPQTLKEVKMKLYKVIIYKNGKKQTQATGNDLGLLRKWALNCQKEDKGITFEVYEEV